MGYTYRRDNIFCPDSIYAFFFLLIYVSLKFVQVSIQCIGKAVVNLQIHPSTKDYVYPIYLTINHSYHYGCHHTIRKQIRVV